MNIINYSSSAQAQLFSTFLAIFVFPQNQAKLSAAILLHAWGMCIIYLMTYE